jgi:hypothetical protein
MQHQQLMEQLQMQNQIALNLQGAKGQNEQQAIAAQGQVDSQLQQQINELKFQTQSMLKNQTAELKKEDTDNKLQKAHDLKQQESLV